MTMSTRSLSPQILSARWLEAEAVFEQVDKRFCMMQSEGAGVWVASEWGAPVPYFAVDHGDGTRNHGYRRVKGLSDLGRRYQKPPDGPNFVIYLSKSIATVHQSKVLDAKKEFSTP